MGDKRTAISSAYPPNTLAISPNAIDWYEPTTKLKRRVAYCRLDDGSYVRVKRGFTSSGDSRFVRVTPQHIECMAREKVFEGGVS